VVVLRPGRHGMILHTMYYQDEVRAMDEFRTDDGLVKDAELKMALSLVEALAAGFQPEKYKDNFRETLGSMIEAKVKGQEIVAPPPAQELAPVIDIMEALKTSLAALKKPPVAEAAEEAVSETIAKSKRKSAPKRIRAAG